MTDPARIRLGEGPGARRELRRAVLTQGPGVAWVAVFLLLPLLAIGAYSLASRGAYGDIEWRWTATNYRRALGVNGPAFDPLYPMIFARTLGLAAATTVLCALVALPLAFFVARLPSRLRQGGLLLLVIPFWTNLLVRTYAWQILFSHTSWASRAAAAFGWIPPGEALFPGTLAVLVVLTCDFLPVLALPLYASIERIDWTLAEAASDLGANGPRVFRHAILPQIQAGLAAGSILVFIGTLGQFAIPDLMGGAKTALIGNVIQQQFGLSRDWPFGSALAGILLLLVLMGLRLCSRHAVDGERKAFP